MAEVFQDSLEAYVNTDNIIKPKQFIPHAIVEIEPNRDAVFNGLYIVNNGLQKCRVGVVFENQQTSDEESK